MTGLHAPPPGTLRAAAGLTAAGLVLVLVPAIAFTATFAWLHAADRCRPAPVELHGSIAPERALAKLEMPEDAGR